MKTIYISPKTYCVAVNSSCDILVGSYGDAVSNDGTQVEMDGYRTNGDARNAAARSGSVWDEVWGRNK